MNHRNLLDDILSIFNLSENCKQVYIASFEHGEQSIGRLADKLKMDRSSAYLAVDQLKAAGLVEINESSRPKTIQAIEPRRVLGRVERQIQNIEEVFDNIHDNIASLEASYKSTDQKPVLQSYTGKDGLKQIVEDILSYKDGEILLFTNLVAEKSVFTKHDHDYFIRKRRQQNLTIKVIASDCPEARQLQATDKNNLRQTKITLGPSPFSCELYIYGKTMAMLSFKEQIIGFIINSADFAEILRWQFNSMWESL
jgi:sugar-specific transcriptional regulator TrmB